MVQSQPTVSTADGGRSFACSAVAVLGFIVNEQEEILLLSHPRRRGAWEVVNGALEAGETLVDGVLREVAEEAGVEVRVRPLGAIHVSTFHYDPEVRFMLSVSYLLAYQGGRVQPGDDMRGSQARWWTVDALADEQVAVLIPPEQKWLFRRAVELHRLWKEEEVDLQPALVINKPKTR